MCSFLLLIPVPFFFQPLIRFFFFEIFCSAITPRLSSSIHSHHRVHLFSISNLSINKYNRLILISFSSLLWDDEFPCDAFACTMMPSPFVFFLVYSSLSPKRRCRWDRLSFIIIAFCLFFFNNCLYSFKQRKHNDKYTFLDGKRKYISSYIQHLVFPTCAQSCEKICSWG